MYVVGTRTEKPDFIFTKYCQNKDLILVLFLEETLLIKYIYGADSYQTLRHY